MIIHTINAVDLIKNITAKGVKVVAVSKTKPLEDIMSLYNSGHTVFGENRTKELKDKYDALPKNIEWHFIGNLQSKQVKYIISFVSMIHSADSEKLLRIINIESGKNNKVTDCLLQIYIAKEETKSGFEFDELKKLLMSGITKELLNINIRGVMAMATFTDDKTQIRNEFRNLKNYFDILKEEFFKEKDSFNEISMGMSNDYEIAVEEGSTMVRIGSLLFGKVS